VFEQKQSKIKGILSMKKLLCLVILCCSFTMALAQEFTLMGRSAIYHTKPNFYGDNLADLAKYQVIIIDPDALVNDPGSFATLSKLLKPGQQIWLYVNFAEIFEDSVIYDGRPWQKRNFELARKNPQYFLKDSAGIRIVYWTDPRMNMMNFTSCCPRVNGLTWLDQCLRSLDNLLKNYPTVSGIFVDNLFDDWDWMTKVLSQGRNFDANNDHRADPNDSINTWGIAGWQNFVNKLRQKYGTKFVICGNEMNGLYPEKDGAMSENFPNSFLGNWAGTMKRYYQQSQNGRYSVLQTTDRKKFKLVVCSALLEDGLFALGQNLVCPLPEITLGKPQAPASSYPAGRTDGNYDESLWLRRYSYVTVVVNPTGVVLEYDHRSIEPRSGVIFDNKSGRILY
jgi:hypothetical protein